MRLLPLVGLLGVAACGGTLMSATRGVTPNAPDVAYQCTQRQLTALGFRMTAHNDVDLRIVGEKLDPNLRVANGLFKRGFHRLEVEIRPDASGNSAYVTTLQTFREYISTQGTTLEETKVPASAARDQAKLIEACAPKAQ